MIYVPDLENYKCFYVYNEGVIRAYEKVPQTNQTNNYRDYYINSSYIYRDGVTQFGSYATLPTCLEAAVLTDSVYYRNDIDKILVIFVILAIVCIVIPFKIFSRFWRRLK